ncbi:DUF5018 domain-containing protein [Salegentibacter flavus]|uniref:DUF5018 domain-containing protein n=1 Tax=Salegentibacter flavus TaxID=287099 RepID=A0A1I5BX46_9FLAO|nr:DUF5018 domain-containing protein [Salegentibacter flavus]SFN79257.1 protein of unknown function [Salegentibacter flavus]
MKKFTFNFILILLTLSIFSCNKSDDSQEPKILSNENQILDFQLPFDGTYISGEIDENSKTISFNTEGQNLEQLTPKIIYSDKASISPAENLPQDFSSEVAYTVYAESGVTEVYRIQVNNRPLSSEKKILSFNVNVNGTVKQAEINHDKHEIYLDAGDFINSIDPEITVSEYASWELTDENPDYSKPVKFRVNAEDETSVIYEFHANKPEFGMVRSMVERLLFYPGANIQISGKFIDLREADEFYLINEDGSKIFPEIISEESFYYEEEHIRYYSATLKIPYSASTDVYKLVVKIRSYRVEFDGIDILGENVPRVSSTDKNEYELNDTLILYGENLKPYIMIPHDGSHYLIFDTGSGLVNIDVNESQTELRFVLDYRWDHFFWPRNVSKKVYLMDEDRRVGESIEVIFK